MSQTAGLEVLLFGPGYGECVLVHLGAGQWMIVDSCLSQRRQQPALEYLSSIGATPDTDVRLVVATHWHDDHVAGLGRVVETCANADFVCSTAMQTEEFLSLVSAGTRAPEHRSGVAEFARVIDLLGVRGFESPRWAMADRRLLSRAEDPPCEVWALSPSDEAFNRSLAEFGGLLEEQRGPVRRRVRAPEPQPCCCRSLGAGGGSRRPPRRRPRDARA